MKLGPRPLAVAAALFSASALLDLLSHATAYGAQSGTSEVSHPDLVLAKFRGCETARTCRFWIESSIPLNESLHVVRPNGVSTGKEGDASALAVRDRLNFLLSDMIHQHKRIELQDLRELDDGAYAATIKVNGMDLSADPILKDLMQTSKN